MTADGRLGVIDFGCVKVIPDDYYDNYFALMNPDTLGDEAKMEKIFWTLDFLLKEDSPQERVFFMDLFKQMIRLLGRPFDAHTFDFAKEGYVDEIYKFLDYISKLPELKSAKSARGSQHGLYVNRTYFGLYSILNDLKANIRTTKPDWVTPKHLKKVLV